MRQMMDEFKEKPSEKTEVSRLELHGLSRKEKRKLIKEQLDEQTEGMSKSEKYKYLLYYYKETLIVTIGILICLIFLVRTVYNVTRPITISYALINCVDHLDYNTDSIHEYAKAIGKYKGYQIKEDANINLSGKMNTQDYNDGSNNQIFVNFMNMVTSDYYDVLFTNGDGAEYLAREGLVNPVNTYLDSDLYNKVKDDIKIFKDKNGRSVEAVVDISDTELAKSMNLGYSDVYICFPGNKERNHVAVEDLLNYLYK